jgi:hypothetical protein
MLVFSFWISLWTSANMCPCKVRLSLQKEQVRTAPSTNSAQRYSVFRPQTGQEKGNFKFSDLPVCSSFSDPVLAPLDLPDFIDVKSNDLKGKESQLSFSFRHPSLLHITLKFLYTMPAPQFQKNSKGRGLYLQSLPFLRFSKQPCSTDKGSPIFFDHSYMIYFTQIQYVPY